MLVRRRISGSWSVSSRQQGTIDCGGQDATSRRLFSGLNEHRFDHLLYGLMQVFHDQLVYPPCADDMIIFETCLLMFIQRSLDNTNAADYIMIQDPVDVYLL